MHLLINIILLLLMAILSIALFILILYACAGIQIDTYLKKEIR